MSVKYLRQNASWKLDTKRWRFEWSRESSVGKLVENSQSLSTYSFKHSTASVTIKFVPFQAKETGAVLQLCRAETSERSKPCITVAVQEVLWCASSENEKLRDELPGFEASGRKYWKALMSNVVGITQIGAPATKKTSESRDQRCEHPIIANNSVKSCAGSLLWDGTYHCEIRLDIYLYISKMFVSSMPAARNSGRDIDLFSNTNKLQLVCSAPIIVSIRSQTLSGCFPISDFWSASITINFVVCRKLAFARDCSL